jgi:hypothetical protein
LHFSAEAISDIADYRLLVTNAYGAATNQAATVIMNLSPVIEGQPASARLLASGSFQLTAMAFGGTPLSYLFSM